LLILPGKNMARNKQKIFEVLVRLTVAAPTYDIAMEMVEEMFDDLRVLEQDGIDNYHIIDTDEADTPSKKVDYYEYYYEEDFNGNY
jgi:hypothetical protein